MNAKILCNISWGTENAKENIIKKNSDITQIVFIWSKCQSYFILPRWESDIPYFAHSLVSDQQISEKWAEKVKSEVQKCWSWPPKCLIYLILGLKTKTVAFNACR